MTNEYAADNSLFVEANLLRDAEAKDEYRIKISHILYVKKMPTYSEHPTSV
jgi:hypothetical protein